MTKVKVDTRAHLILLFFTVLSVGLYFLGKQISQESIQGFLASSGPWAPILYILLHQASFVLAPISGYPFLIVGFFLFGKTTIIYNLIVAIIGSSLNFLIAKRWGRPIVKKLAGENSLAEIDKFSKKYGLGMLFILRLFLNGVGDFVSYGYGLTPMKFLPFILVSTAGMIPGYIFWYIIAARFGNIEQFIGLSLILTFSASAVFFAVNYLYKKHFKQLNTKN